MFRTLSLALLFALLCVTSVTWSPISASAQDGLWENYMDAGRQALEQRDFPAAEKHFAAALSEAKRDGPETERVAATLYGQAELLADRGNEAEVEPLLRRALAIREKVLPTDHPDLAVSLQWVA